MTRTVLITGGTGGLGRETARVLATAGWRVVITGRDAGQVADRAVELTAAAGAAASSAASGAAAGSAAAGAAAGSAASGAAANSPATGTAAASSAATGAASGGAATTSAPSAGTVVGLPLDLGDLEDVRRFAAEVAASEKELHAVICNAGTQTVSGTTLTKDGYEETFGVNHLAHFLLVRELLPHLAEPARIVFVASGTHDPAQHTGMPAPVYTTARDLAYPRAAADGRRNYTTSKLCNVLTTYELARQIDGQNGGNGQIDGQNGQIDGQSGGNRQNGRRVTVNAFDPGLMPGTGLARDYGRVQAFAWRYVLPVLTIVPGLNAHTPARSAKNLARLITDEGLEHTTGRYFEGAREVTSSKDSYDRDKASDLWNTSVQLTSTKAGTT